MALDVSVFYVFNALAGLSAAFDQAVVFFASQFQYFVIAAFLIFVWFSARAAKKRMHLFWTAALSLVASRAVVEFVHFLWHRPRPYMEFGFDPLVTPMSLFGDVPWSFPSGHATFFFVLATAVYLHDKKWGALFYGAAALISISRVIAGVHYPSDIIGGAVVGVLVAVVVHHAMRFKQRYSRRA